jgi:YVTN family beta-propeller protein
VKTTATHPSVIVSLALCGVAIVLLVLAPWMARAGRPSRFSGPQSSQPLALSADDEILVVANADNNTVSIFDLKHGRKIAEEPVQTEPNGVAVMPDGKTAFAANTVSGTVSVIKIHGKGNASTTKHIPVGVEPYSMVLTPNATRLYVANARSNSISVIDTQTEEVIHTVQNVGIEPRGLAITNDGDDDDSDETLYVTQFLSLPISGKIDGADDAKAGHVTLISTATNAVIGQVILNPIPDTGFKANGDALARIPPGPTFTFTTGAYPNQLNNIAIHGDFAYVPNTGASPNGPVRFDVNTHSLLSVINRATNTDAGKTINMHRAVAQQTGAPKLFITQPWVMAFKHHSNEGYVASAASNILVKVRVDGTGTPSVLNDPLDPTRVLQVKVGKNPRGIVITSDDRRAFVMNYVSRDVSVIDLTGLREEVVDTFQSAALPAAGTVEDEIHAGKELYNTSVGVFDPATPGGAPITGRMSNNGWGACSACHTPFGLSDNVVWIFPSGPKRTIPQHTDFDQTDPTRNTMRILNWSAERDEEEDFELNIRAVSGGLGIIVQADGVSQEPNVFNLTPLASANRNQLRIRGVGGWDAIKAFVQFGIRAPISPNKNDPDTAAGRSLFIAANCQQCHGGPQWTSSKVRFLPPPSAALISNGQIIGELRKVGTFDPAFFNEVRQNAAPPLGADGFVPPSLLSLFAFPQTFFHNGAVDTLDAVLANVTHRSAGTGGVDTLSNAADRAKIVKFLLSIDASTPSVPLP